MNWPVVLQTVSVMVGAISFVYGVNAWRRGVVGQKRIDLAVRTIVAFKKIDQAVREVRSPISSAGEGSTRRPRPGESDRDAEVSRMAFVAIERLDARSDRFMEIEGIKFEFQAYFGRDLDSAFAEVISIRQEIVRAAYRLEMHWKKQGGHFRTKEHFEEHLRGMHAAEAIFWEGHDDPDPLLPRIDAMISKVEDYCREIIDPAPTFRAAWRGALKRVRRYFFGS